VVKDFFCGRHVQRSPNLPASQLEQPRLTVYKLRKHDAGARVPSDCNADYEFPSNSLQPIDYKAEVVELADTPS
jgi:hypothetical protein